MRACWLLSPIQWSPASDMLGGTLGRAPAAKSFVVRSSPTGGIPDTLASYRKRVADLTQGRATNIGRRDDRRQSDLAGDGGLGVAACVTLITRIV
jgi:hypothetical protein